MRLSNFIMAGERDGNKNEAITYLAVLSLRGEVKYGDIEGCSRDRLAQLEQSAKEYGVTLPISQSTRGTIEGFLLHKEVGKKPLITEEDYSDLKEHLKKVDHIRHIHYLASNPQDYLPERNSETLKKMYELLAVLAINGQVTSADLSDRISPSADDNKLFKDLTESAISEKLAAKIGSFFSKKEIVATPGTRKALNQYFTGDRLMEPKVDNDYNNPISSAAYKRVKERLKNRSQQREI